MKTAISIPDPLFSKAEKLRKKLKLSRSQLYAQAVEKYLSEQSRPDIRTMTDEEITASLNRNHARGKPGRDPALASLQYEALRREEW